jgi:hypothetical protein
MEVWYFYETSISIYTFLFMKKNLILFILFSLQIQWSAAQFSILKDLVAGADSGVKNTTQIVSFKNKLYFAGAVSNAGLFQTDGTAAGTKNFLPPSTVNDIKNMSAGKTKLFIIADSKLMSNDGINTATATLKASNFGFSDFYQMKDDTFLVISPLGDNRANLWKTDGTTAGTKLDLSIPYNQGYMRGSVYKKGIVFSEKSTNSTKAAPVWTDGTFLKSIAIEDYMQPLVGFDKVEVAVGIGDFLLVEGTVNKINKTYLTDGTAAGTKEIATWGTLATSHYVNGKWFVLTDNSLYIFNDKTKELEEIVHNEVDYFSNPYIYKNKLYFHDSDGFIRVSDGTATGTKKISKASKGATYFDPVLWGKGDSLFYSVREGTKKWRAINLTTGADELFADTKSDLNFNPSIGNIGNQIIFSKYEDASGQELWQFNPSTTAAPLAANIIQKKQITCFASANASIEAIVTGGIAPYTYKWSESNSTTSLAENLTAGVYFLTATDSKAKTIVSSITVTQPTDIKYNLVVVKAWNNQNNGTASLENVTGGTFPYTYKWSNAQTSAKVSGLAPNNYSVTLSDANGCSKIIPFTILAAPLRSNDIFDTNQVVLFPNPTSATLHFQNLSEATQYQISISDLKGTDVLYQSLSTDNTALDVSSLASGFYIVKIRVDDKIFTKKLIKL